MYTEPFGSAFKVFFFMMLEGIMPPANLHGKSTLDFIVPIYIECTFEFIEA